MEFLTDSYDIDASKILECIDDGYDTNELKTRYGFLEKDSLIEILDSLVDGFSSLRDKVVTQGSLSDIFHDLELEAGWLFEDYYKNVLKKHSTDKNEELLTSIQNDTEKQIKIFWKEQTKTFIKEEQ